MTKRNEDIIGLGFGAGSEEYRHSVFEELFYDSVYLAYMAHDQAEREDAPGYDGDLHSAMLARASIMSSMLTIEAAANCCLDVVPWPRVLRDDIDKLPALSKLELFLKHHDSAKVLDRGVRPVQQIEDLKGLRDRVVHPKIRRAEWTRVNDTTRQVDLGRSKVLGLPFDTGSWGPGDAREALRAVTEFFNYFFIEVCGLTSNQTCEILVGDGPINLEAPTNYQMDGGAELKRAATQWNLDLSFFGVQHKS